jgi:hypothetical protein
MTDLRAFHNDPELKAFVLNQLALHREADKLVKGDYWKNGKGCAIGCTLEAVRLYNGKFGIINHESHALYESELGIPRNIARLEDQFFEALPNGDSQAWPERFTSAIHPGADLTMIWPRFAHWLLTEEVPPRTKNPRSLASLAEVGALYRERIDGASPSAERWLIVEKTTYAATAAVYAAYAAVYAAKAARDAAATVYTAYAAYAAVYAAKAAAAADDAADARTASYRRQSDKLIELLAAAKT